MNLYELFDAENFTNLTGRDIADALEDRDFLPLEEDPEFRKDIISLLSDIGYAGIDAHDASAVADALSTGVLRLADEEGMDLIVAGEASSISVEGTALGDLSEIIDYRKAAPVVAGALGLTRLLFGREPVWVEIR